jgi:hypothetical protein
MKSAGCKYLGIICVSFICLMAAACSFDSTSNPIEITSKPKNPNPPNNATSQGMSLTISWEADNAAKFDVYLDTNNPPQHLYESDNTSKSVNLMLTAQTKYYWRVVSKFNTSSVEGDVWSFTTGNNINPGMEGQVLIRHSAVAEKPSTVNLIFQVLNYDGSGVGNLVKDNFTFLEDEQPIFASESDLVINKKTDVFDTLHVVLMLDNSTSLAPNIEQIRLAASLLAYNLVNTTIDGKKLNVDVSVYTFSEKVTKLCDFLKDKDRLYGVVWDNYALGQASTDLYGAVVTGTSKWKDLFSADKVRQGVMILFTDGTDTQGSRSFGEALSAVNNKKVFAVGLGNDIDPYVLERIGTAGYFPVTDITQLRDKFDEVQRKLIDYINSFYVLKYVSPKRGNFDHVLKLSIKNNLNTGAASYIEFIYNSFGFYSN